MEDQKILCYTLKIMNDCIGFDVYNQAVTGEVSMTVTAKRSDTHHVPVVFCISPYGSNAMLSDNPYSGIYEAETSRTLDLNGGNPACHQGGMIVLAAIEGNGCRPSHLGIGINDGKTMYTLNSTEIHGGGNK